MNISGFLPRKSFLHKNSNTSVVPTNLSVESTCPCCVKTLELKIVIVTFLSSFVGNILQSTTSRVLCQKVKSLKEAQIVSLTLLALSRWRWKKLANLSWNLSIVFAGYKHDIIAGDTSVLCGLEIVTVLGILYLIWQADFQITGTT